MYMVKERRGPERMLGRRRSDHDGHGPLTDGEGILAKKKTKLGMGIGAVVAIAAGGLLFAAPANAALAPPSSCPAGFVCNYRDANFAIKMTPFEYYIPEYAAFDMHDKITSIANNGRTSNAILYKNERYGGDSFVLYRGEADGYLGNTVGAVHKSGFDDQIDSGRFV